MSTDIDQHIFTDAVRRFWKTRDIQAKSQADRGVSDQGARTAVTGGHQMDGFVSKIKDLIIEAGISSSDIFTASDTDLPGFFRSSKKWDIVVVSNNRLLVTVEVKSHVGPSFGNNFNNRTEEAIGSAVDLWTAYREGAFRASPQPWLGYLILLEDCPRSTTPVTIFEPHFLVFPEFKNASYTKRYELLCRKLVLERHYNSACFITADRKKAGLEKNYTEPTSDLGVSQFLRQLIAHVNCTR